LLHPVSRLLLVGASSPLLWLLDQQLRVVGNHNVLLLAGLYLIVAGGASRGGMVLRPAL
jgi:hypothetical protein